MLAGVPSLGGGTVQIPENAEKATPLNTNKTNPFLGTGKKPTTTTNAGILAVLPALYSFPIESKNKITLRII